MDRIRFSKRIIYFIKEKISRVVLFFLYRATKVLAKEDSKIMREFQSWENGLSVAINCALNGPALYLIKNGNKLAKVKKLEKADMSLKLSSYNVDPNCFDKVAELSLNDGAMIVNPRACCELLGN